MMRSLAGGIAALALLASTSGCGVDCAEFCNKIESCNAGVCESSTCETICERQQQAGTPLGSFEDQASCVLDSSCQELDSNGCYFNTLNFGAWCGG